MNEDKRELAELLERHAREMAAHFLGHVNSIQDAALSKLLRTASEALTAVGAHLRARREEGRELYGTGRADHGRPSQRDSHMIRATMTKRPIVSNCPLCDAMEMATGDLKIENTRDAAAIGFLMGMGAASALFQHGAPLGLCNACKTETNTLMKKARALNPDVS